MQHKHQKISTALHSIHAMGMHEGTMHKVQNGIERRSGPADGRASGATADSLAIHMCAVHNSPLYAS